MGFRSSISNDVFDAINELGDLAEKVNYQQIKPGSYNIETGESSDTVKKYSPKGVFTRVNESHRALVEPVKGDMLLILATKGLSFRPEVQDIVIRNKQNYEVVAIAVDPAEASYQLIIRLM